MVSIWMLGLLGVAEGGGPVGLVGGSSEGGRILSYWGLDGLKA